MIVFQKVYSHTSQKLKFPIKGFFSKCGQICSFLRIWSHLLKKSLIEILIFSAVTSAVPGSGLREVRNIWKKHSNKMINFLLIVCFHGTKNYQSIFLFLNNSSNIQQTILYIQYMYSSILHEEAQKQCVNIQKLVLINRF